MGIFDSNVYVAEFQIATLDPKTRTLSISQRRPQGGFGNAIKRLRTSSLVVAAIALYSQNRPCAYDERRWLEGHWALGMKLQIVERNSRKYKKLVDCLIYPQPPAIEYVLEESFFRRLMLAAGRGKLLG